MRGIDYKKVKQNLDELYRTRRIDQDTYFFRLKDLEERERKEGLGIHWNDLREKQKDNSP